MGDDWTEQEPLDKAAEMAARTVRAAGQAKQAADAIQAAHTAAGAAGSGGAVAGTTAGTALGGPLGAVIGTLLTSRMFWKAVVAVVAAVLLFLYIVVNSVGIIFTYLGFADADSYVSQAREAEYRNIKIQIETLFSEKPELRTEISTLIWGYRDRMMEEITQDFYENWDSYDGYEVEDECKSRLEPMLSQYLAVLMEESFSGSQIVGFNGYGASDGYGTDLTSIYDEYFALAAAAYQVPEALLKAMGKAESGFDPNAVSSAGAMGIMQLMPATAANLGVTDPFDPKQNIMGGAKYLAELLRTFGAYSDGVRLAVAAYNAGPGAVKRAGYKIPQNGETPVYVERVMGYLSTSGGDGSVPVPGEGEEQGGTMTQPGAAVSAVLLKSLVENHAEDFFGWAQTGTHTETVDSGNEDEEDEEIEIVDYAVVLKLNSQLAATDTGYTYRYVTNQTAFQSVLTLFGLLKDGSDGIRDLLFKAASWKNYIVGAGASEDIYTSEIQTGGDTIHYDTVGGCVQNVVYYNQGEEPWASLSYGTSNIRSAGCGPTGLAIIISTLTGERVTPEMTAAYAIANGLYVSGKGTSHAFPSMAAGNWGLEVERVKRERMDYVVRQLKEGRLAAVICAENTISKSGHFIVLTGVTEDGYIAIADPGSRSRTGKLYSPATIQSYARDLSDGGIWIIGGN